MPLASPKKPAKRTASRPTIRRESSAPYSSGRGGPATAIEIEGHTAPSPLSADRSMGPSTLKSANRMTQTPYEDFRKWKNSLAVTDLTRLSWCELQVDYNERQRSYYPVETRRTTFNSAQGNLISVDVDVMKNNDTITKLGRAIHEALQQEIDPRRDMKINLKLLPKRDLCRWAQRLVEMIDCVQSLKTQGRCREMPVFGIMHGLVVHGVIDHIQRRAIPPKALPDSPASASHTAAGSKLKRKLGSASVPATPEPKSKKARTTPHTGRESPVDAEAVLQLPTKASACRYYLHISDTKTRSEPGMPPKQETVHSRLQLMLYRKLLSGILASPSSSQAVDPDAVWPLVGISPTENLPVLFVQQAKLHRYGPSGTAWTLNELVRVFRDSVKALHVAKINNMLSIVYRTQADVEVATDTAMTVEERWPVIGTRTFLYDEQVLQKFITSAFEYWNGQREPRGVEESMMGRRCVNCEYKPSCEWRAQKGVN